MHIFNLQIDGILIYNFDKYRKAATFEEFGKLGIRSFLGYKQEPLGIGKNVQVEI
jgi:hypothetical protein